VAAAQRTLRARSAPGVTIAAKRVRARVRVPATSANLGPGFDALGLCLTLYNDVTVTASDRVSVVVAGEGADHLPAGEENVVVRGARMLFAAAGRPFTGLAVECVNRIPLSRGLGSSAAAWLGGLIGANALLGEPLDRAALLRLAARAEGHPDNVAAALYGGITVACATDGGVQAVSLPPPVGVRWVILVPDVTCATAEARAVLPAQVPLADAVFNVQRVALLLAGFQTGRAALLRHAMDDRLHQPYRLQLFPWMPAVVAAAQEAGALGCVLSGAGPCLLAAVTETASEVAGAMERTLAIAGVTGVARALDVDPAGAIVQLM
jgi:homoserine kinase